MLSAAFYRWAVYSFPSDSKILTDEQIILNGIYKLLIDVEGGGTLRKRGAERKRE